MGHPLTAACALKDLKELRMLNTPMKRRLPPLIKKCSYILGAAGAAANFWYIESVSNGSLAAFGKRSIPAPAALQKRSKSLAKCNMSLPLSTLEALIDAFQEFFGLNLSHNSVYPSIDPTLPSLSLAGKSVTITGGGSGIGLAISKALALALAGASRIAIIGRRTEVLAKAEATIKDLVGDKTKVLTFSADVGNKEQLDRAFEEVWEAFGRRSFDVLVNNADYWTGVRPFGTETVDEWNQAVNVNIMGVYLVASAFIAKAKKDATIINVSNGLVHLPASFRPGFASYCSTKLAGDKIMEFVQAENPDLHVVGIHPGQVTETEMARRFGLPHIDDGAYPDNHGGNILS